VKYLPGIKLGKNVVADPDLENAGISFLFLLMSYLSSNILCSDLLFWWGIYYAAKDANMLVFVTPHQFMEGICKKLVGKIKGDVEAISLIKGMEVKMEGPCMISTLISQQLGISCCVLMGANIANEVINMIFHNSPWRFMYRLIFLKLEVNAQIAVEKFSEATVGYRENRESAEKWVQLFSTPYFLVTAVSAIDTFSW
jgi:glycerol-3-phosphate dehydrogenase (NAD+)